jgi:hypothetical protein
MEQIMKILARMEAKIYANVKEVTAEMRVWRKETTACLESKESTSVQIVEFVAVHEEVPKEEATVKTVRELKKRYGYWHLAVGCRRQLQKWTPGRWWVPEEVGCCLQRDDPPCRSSTA